MKLSRAPLIQDNAQTPQPSTPAPAPAIIESPQEILKKTWSQFLLNHCSCIANVDVNVGKVPILDPHLNEQEFFTTINQIAVVQQNITAVASQCFFAMLLQAAITWGVMKIDTLEQAATPVLSINWISQSSKLAKEIKEKVCTSFIITF